VIRAERINPDRVPQLSSPVVLSLGSNLGDREATLRGAVAEILALPGTIAVAASALVETPALKLLGVDEDAPAYLNAILIVRSTLRPLDLLDALNRIEAEHGRVREERWGDRTLDIDIVAFGDLVVDSDRLTLPHPRAFERAFVLAPWLDADPDAQLPGHGRVDALLAALPNDVRPYPAEALL
jgi:2-amino-4-hydroxy-6-hydroxymethyldihydropteridine diphosphokinase